VQETARRNQSSMKKPKPLFGECNPGLSRACWTLITAAPDQVHQLLQWFTHWCEFINRLLVFSYPFQSKFLAHFLSNSVCTVYCILHNIHGIFAAEITSRNSIGATKKFSFQVELQWIWMTNI
jgi:hypothetical protein